MPYGPRPGGRSSDPRSSMPMLTKRDKLEQEWGRYDKYTAKQPKDWQGGDLFEGKWDEKGR
jgi:hypothetical protein